MEVVQWILNQPTEGFSFFLADSAGVRAPLTGYEFTINLAHEDGVLTASYVVPASTGTTAPYDLIDVVDGSSNPITETLGKWIGRVTITLNGDPYNVSKVFTVVISN
jgi:hypothetical protein